MNFLTYLSLFSLFQAYFMLRRVFNKNVSFMDKELLPVILNIQSKSLVTQSGILCILTSLFLLTVFIFFILYRNVFSVR